MTTPRPDMPSNYELDYDDRSPARRKTVMSITLVAVSALVVGWVYVLFFYDPGLMIDELADRTFPIAAEQICAEAQVELNQLEPANLASSPLDRADTIAVSNEILTQMVEDLRPIVPAEPAEVHDGIEEWLGDWETYIDDRREYVTNLRSDPEARFLETTKATPNKGITRAMNGFAQVNRMDSCVSPGDVS